jgi:taurine dioxygenase
MSDQRIKGHMSKAMVERYPGKDADAALPITPHIGAVLRGVTLSASPDEDILVAIRAALAKHLVLVIKDQELTPATLRDFVAHFGPLFLHHADEGVICAEGVLEVLEMRKEPDGERLFGGSDWHADVTFRKPGGYLSVLHALIVPPVGGDTGFASTIAAFQALSPGMRELLRGLEAVHSYDGPGKPDREGQTAIHPVVRRHPETGAREPASHRLLGSAHHSTRVYLPRALAGRPSGDVGQPLHPALPDQRLHRAPAIADPVHGTGGLSTLASDRLTTPHRTDFGKMDKSEAAKVLQDHVSQYRAKPYAELKSLIGNVQVHEATGASGAEYTLEFDVLWDSDPDGDIRVIGGIDDGTFPSAFSPLSDDFILSPDGKFVGE